MLIKWQEVGWVAAMQLGQPGAMAAEGVSPYVAKPGVKAVLVELFEAIKSPSSYSTFLI
jgi:hypothetical protein